MQNLKRTLYTSGLLLVLMVSGSWGFLAHRTINQLAVYELPKDLCSFYYDNLDYLVRNAPRPDVRRNTDSTEANKHFIDLEFYGDSAAWKMPMNWDDAVRTYSKDSLLKYGYLPYLIMRVKDSLTDAFRNRNSERILFYTADLGHYIGDAHVPLHTSINYDGQLTNQKGLHSLWESMIPELELNNYDLSSRHKAKYLRDPQTALWGAIRNSFSLLNDVFSQEIAATSGFTDSTKFRIQNRRGRDVKSFTTDFAKAYSAKLGNSINKQLTSSADMLADFIYTSWVDAGKPDVKHLIRSSFKTEKKQQLKKERKAFKHNELIRDSMLLARKLNFNAE
ncbi:MAG TPA: zinc dependent phospholipase C family protein [Chitinophagaceae bacterium]|nr:zinc dependent phospholipase C family protein [Chitinophagaceae bacterium]